MKIDAITMLTLFYKWRSESLKSTVLNCMLFKFRDLLVENV